MKKIFLIVSGWIFSSTRSRFLFGVTVTALFIRLGIIIVAGNPQHPEMYEHGAIADNLYHGHGFAMHWPYASLDPQRIALMQKPPQFEGAFMPPINPYQIFFIYKIFGETPVAIWIIMLLGALYSSLIPLAVFHTAKLFSSENQSRISSLIAVFFFPAAFAVTTFSGSSLYQLIVVLTLGCAIRSVQNPSNKNFILLGFSAAIMTLLRSEFLIIGAVLIIAAGILAHINKKKINSLRLIIPAVFIFAAIISPWTIRNYFLFGKFVPIVDHPWHEIWRGNNLYASGSTYDAIGNSVWENSNQYPKVIRALDSLTYDKNFDLRADSIFHHEVLAFIHDHPARFAELSAIKIFSLLTIDYHHTASRNPLYFILMMAIIIPSILGMIALFRNSRTSGNFSIFSLYSIFFLYYCVIIVSTFILPRYQIYIFSALLPVTGMGILTLKQKFSTI